MTRGAELCLLPPLCCLVLQSVLQCVAECVAECVAVCCSVLQRNTTCSHNARCRAVSLATAVLQSVAHCVAVCCSVCCGVLQCVAVHCSVTQRVHTSRGAELSLLPPLPAASIVEDNDAEPSAAAEQRVQEEEATRLQEEESLQVQAEVSVPADDKQVEGGKEAEGIAGDEVGDDVVHASQSSHRKHRRKSSSPEKTRRSRSNVQRAQPDSETAATRHTDSVETNDTHRADGLAAQAHVQEQQRRKDEQRTREHLVAQRAKRRPHDASGPRYSVAPLAHAARTHEQATVELQEDRGVGSEGMDVLGKCLAACVNRFAGVHHVKCVRHEDNLDAAKCALAPSWVPPSHTRADIQNMAERRRDHGVHAQLCVCVYTCVCVCNALCACKSFAL